MLLLFWLVGTVVGSTFVVYASFMALCTAKRWLDAGIELKWDIKVTAVVLLFIGYPADILFNVTRGRYMFGEFRGRTFSSRIQHYVNRPEDCEDIDERDYWAQLLNVGDPNHIRHVVEK